mgnify:CR=1 FL=1
MEDNLEKKLKITISIIMEVILLISLIITIILSKKQDYSIVPSIICLSISQICIFILIPKKKKDYKN